MEIRYAAELLAKQGEDVGRVGRDIGHQAARGRVDWLQRMLIEVNRTEPDEEAGWFAGYREAMLDILGGLLNEATSRDGGEDVLARVKRAPVRCAVVRALASAASTPVELAAKIGKKTEQVSRALGELQEMDVVQALVSDDDKRKRPVRLTIRGREVAKKLQEAAVSDDVVLGIELATEYHAALVARGRAFRDDYLGWASTKVSSDVAAATWGIITEAAEQRHLVSNQAGTAYLVPDASEAALSTDESAEWIAAWAEKQNEERGIELIFLRSDSRRDDWMQVISRANELCKSVEVRHVMSVDIKLSDDLPKQDRPYDIVYTHLFMRDREPSLVEPVVTNAKRTWLLTEDETFQSDSLWPLYIAGEVKRMRAGQHESS